MICVLLVSLQLIAIIPIMAYMTSFMDAEQVVTTLMAQGLNALIGCIDDSEKIEKDKVYFNFKF